MELTEKLAEAKRLGDILERSLSLEKAIPNVFKKGSVSFKVTSFGSHGQPIVKLTQSDGKLLIDSPLIELSPEILEHFKDLILNVGKRLGVHRDWRILSNKFQK